MSPWTEDQIVEFVLGTLEPEADARLADELADDPALAERVAEVAELITAFASAPDADDRVQLTESRPVPSADGRRRLLDRVAEVSRFAPLAPRVAELLEIDENEAMRWLDGLDDPSNWGPGVLPGTTMWPVPTTEPDVGAVWLKMPPGMAFPHHEHLGDETVLVVQGQYFDHLDRLHPPGSVLRESAHSDHAFRIGADGPPFICLAIVRGGIRIGDTDVTRDALYGT